MTVIGWLNCTIAALFLAGVVCLYMGYPKEGRSEPTDRQANLLLWAIGLIATSILMVIVTMFALDLLK